MERNNLFTEAQHGFISGRSCTTQLLEVMEKITQALDRGEDVDVIYLDFAKAFDKVPHQRLLQKLSAYGIMGKVYNWIKGVLSYRKQRVVINGITLNGEMLPQEYLKEVFWAQFSSLFLSMTCQMS